MFKGLSAVNFSKKFKHEDDCKAYLFHYKWKDGFRCSKCDHTISGKGRTQYHHRCKKCGYDESPTTATLFHNMKFSLLKAFWIMFRLSTEKCGISSLAIARQFDLDPKTSLRFLNRMRMAMAEDSIRTPIKKKHLEVRKLDSINIANRGKKLNGFQQINIVYERSTHNRLYLVPESRRALFTFNECPEKSELLWGHYVNENKDIKMWNFKTSVTGVNHQCSAKYLDGYIAEFLFRNNYRGRPHIIWHKLLATLLKYRTRDKRAVANKRVDRRLQLR